MVKHSLPWLFVRECPTLCLVDSLTWSDYSNFLLIQLFLLKFSSSKFSHFLRGIFHWFLGISQASPYSKFSEFSLLAFTLSFNYWPISKNDLESSFFIRIWSFPFSFHNFPAKIALLSTYSKTTLSAF